MMVHAVDPVPTTLTSRQAKPPLTKIWAASEPPFRGYHSALPTTNRSNVHPAVVIDLGSSTVRAGWSNNHAPTLSVPPLMARYKDRKLNRTFTFVGSDVYADGTARGQAKNIFEPGSNIVNNWDVVEGVFDYIFHKMGVVGASGGIGRPICVTEPVANLGYARRTMSEVLFECYFAPEVAYGIDALFAYRHNGGRTGLVVSSSYTSTHMIPVYEERPLLSYTTRLDWGRVQSAEFLQKVLRLKYPAFPAKITDPQLEDLIKEHCYISQNYEEEISHYLDWSGLEDRDHIIQWPFTEQVVVAKTDEELARQAEKRKESGRRLQEQAAKMRLEKLVRKEQELEYYKDLQQRLALASKKDKQLMLESDDFDSEAQLERKVKDMQLSIRRARNKDVGDVEEEVEEAFTYPLLDIADDQLDEEKLKQKRQQRLLKSNHDARKRAKDEKEREKARKAEEERQDAERRENDLDSWLEERRIARQAIIQKIKDRERLKADLGNRKSLASQLRMKSIANLASDNPSKKRRRAGAPGGDDDTFGADDADWGVYRAIATGEQSDDDDEEDLAGGLKAVEAQLLQHDPTFTEASTREAQKDWTKSLVHAFLRGPWPFDPEAQREMHQVHLNVERIRVPEVVFQPSIAGLDQAGIVEIAADILTQRLADEAHRSAVLKDVFLTGGNTLFQGFEQRLRNDLQAFLPAGAPLGVRRAKDPLLDAWTGAARWADANASTGRGFATREEWMENGPDYFKEHNLGNAVV